MNIKPKVAFICVHNSCRSQIAEALGKYFALDTFDSFSAGTEIKPQINQDAVRIIKKLGNTKEHLLLFYEDTKDLTSIPKNEIIKIKFEVDTNPPKYATFERKYCLQPVPYEVNLYDESSLFAGKLHAVLGRSWKNRVKGRDLYDYVFYLTKGIAVNQKHLRERLIQSGHINEQRTIHAASGVEKPELLSIGEVTIDMNAGKVYIGTKQVDLTALEYRLLLIFASNKSRLLTRTQILENIWDYGENYVEDNTLTVYVKRLREKLGDAVTIETVRGIGYRVD